MAASFMQARASCRCVATQSGALPLGRGVSPSHTTIAPVASICCTIDVVPESQDCSNVLGSKFPIASHVTEEDRTTILGRMLRMRSSALDRHLSHSSYSRFIVTM